MMNSRVVFNRKVIVKKLQELVSCNRCINIIKNRFFAKVLLIEVNMMIKYISIPKGKPSDIERLLDSYIQRNFVEKEKLRFNNKVVSLRRKEKGILLYCIRPSIELEKLLSVHKKVKIIPLQEYIYKKVIRKYSKEERMLVFYFDLEGKGIVEVIYKKYLIYTSSTMDKDLERINEVVDECCNHIRNIYSIENDDWTVILINIGIDKVKSSNKTIKEMKLVRSC